MANRPENKPVLHSKKHIARLERERMQTRIILYSFIVVLVAVAGLVIYGYLDTKYFQFQRPVAKVAGTEITVGQWQARVRMERTRLINQLTLYEQYSQYFGMDLSSQTQQLVQQLNDPTTLGQSVINQMIDDELIRDEAAKRGITVSPKQIDEAIQSSYGYFPNGSPTPTLTPTAVTLPTLSPETLALVTLTPTPGGPTATAVPELTPSPSPSPAGTSSPAATGSPAATASPTATTAPTLTPTPAATSTPAPTFTPQPTSTPYTLQGFQNSYKQGLAKLVALGLTEDQVRQIYATNILRQKLFDIITANVPRSQDEVWARHILVADQATALAVRQRLLNGEDFAKVAAEVSTDTGSKSKGGDLGWFPKGQMVAEFEAAAFSMKIGQISQPVKSQFGYHIIQVLAHADVPLDASAYDQAKQTAFTNWLTGLRSQYTVATYNNWQNLVPTDPPVPAIPQ
ncbi:MAG TPA: peptidylprolyl isomerase [Anaerolineales bacterium]